MAIFGGKIGVSEALTSGSRLTAERSGMTPPFKEYRTIPLTQGQVAIVDAADYEWLSQWKWCAFRPCTGYLYAGRSGKRQPPKANRKHGSKPIIRMHVEILGTAGQSGVVVDHVNGNGLDNRRENLRTATHSQNSQNTKVYLSHSLATKGVRATTGGRFQARIFINGKRVNLGTFDTKEEAHAEYGNAARTHFGEFARVA